MRKLITLITGIYMAASFMGCSSTGLFNSGNHEKDLNALVAYNIEWQEVGQPQLDEIGRNLVIRAEESQEGLLAFKRRAQVLPKLNAIDLSITTYLEKKGIEDTPETRAPMFAEALSAMSEGDQQQINSYCEANEAFMREQNDNMKEIGGMIVRGIPLFLQAQDRIKQGGADDLVDMIMSGEAKAIKNGMDQMNTLEDWRSCYEEFVVWHMESGKYITDAVKINDEQRSE